MSITLPRFDISIMKSGHIEGCAHLDKSLFPEDCYSPKDFHRFIRTSRCIIPIVATSSGSVMGFHVMMVRSNCVYGIRTVVNPQIRGLGCGTAMMEYMHKVAHRKPCIVPLSDCTSDAERKQSFLRHCGYRLVRVNRDNEASSTYLFRREPECSQKKN